MAKDEMDIITEDKWDEDIWGIEHQAVDSKMKVPKLVFYFGENVSLPSHTVINYLLNKIRTTGS